MRVLIVTVAGMSTRFSESLGKSCLKCVYYHENITESLLYRMLNQPVDFDKYIVVGGYQFYELQKIINDKFAKFAKKIILVNNEQYEKYGSGYSLYYGLRTTMELQFQEVVFAEGDLFVDSESFINVCTCRKDVVTCNQEAILANKAVAFYYDEQNIIHYIYDTGHHSLVIQEPFLAIYNSGQIWKFADSDRLRSTYSSMSQKDWQGTNLVLIERYFSQLKCEEYEIIPFKRWINCNTVSDFERIEKLV